MAGQVEIVFTEELKKSYKKLPSTIQKKFKKQLKFLQSNPKHPSLKIHRLNDEWEFYVDIHYRCFFHQEGNKYTLLTIGEHRIVDRYTQRR
ncbi:cytotoxin [Candidatus Poribacteria bacterium]|nr:cytotoxin [Candidatus Poribacteria bacterium]